MIAKRTLSFFHNHEALRSSSIKKQKKLYPINASTSKTELSNRSCRLIRKHCFYIECLQQPHPIKEIKILLSRCNKLGKLSVEFSLQYVQFARRN